MKPYPHLNNSFHLGWDASSPSRLTLLIIFVPLLLFCHHSPKKTFSSCNNSIKVHSIVWNWFHKLLANQWPNSDAIDLPLWSGEVTLLMQHLWDHGSNDGLHFMPLTSPDSPQCFRLLERHRSGNQVSHPPHSSSGDPFVHDARNNPSQFPVKDCCCLNQNHVARVLYLFT